MEQRLHFLLLPSRVLWPSQRRESPPQFSVFPDGALRRNTFARKNNSQREFSRRSKPVWGAEQPRGRRRKIRSDGKKMCTRSSCATRTDQPRSEDLPLERTVRIPNVSPIRLCSAPARERGPLCVIVYCQVLFIPFAACIIIQKPDRTSE